MVTSKLACLGLVIAVSGCGLLTKDDVGEGSSKVGGTDPETKTDAGSDTPIVTTPEEAYPGKGFVVHEWGTNTVVVGTDGSLQRGLHHEEEDLPEFVLDRMKQGNVSVDVKMETPVTYFYSDTPRTVSVQVRFPRGLFSQWFPQVKFFTPGMVREGASFLDPYTDPSFAYRDDVCRQKMLTPRDGLLDWGDVAILAPGDKPTLRDAALDRYTWSYARNVAANPVRVGTEHEKFLFYRGLGNLPMGVTITGTSVGGVHLVDTDATHAVGSVFVLRVEKDRAGFLEQAEGIPAGGSFDAQPPAATLSLDDYAKGLADAMASALVRAGLYRDEARAMVDTWSHQWFRTPGIRVLYLAPQAWTDDQIPLTINPVPEKTVRVMVIRNEILTQELEDVDLKFVALFDADAALARGHFVGLGRFAEPRLRRAIAQYGSTPKGASDLLATLTGPNATSGAH